MLNFLKRLRMNGKLSRFARDNKGSTAILFGLSIVCLVALVGLAIDVGNAYRLREKAQGAADAAALAVVISAKDYLSKQSSTDPSVLESARSIFAQQAQSYFNYNNSSKSLASSPADVALNLKSDTLSATVSFQSTMRTAFIRAVGFKSLPISVTSTAQSNLPPFVEVHLLIDTSGSMALGASEADQSMLVARTGCAFACHDGSPVNGYPDAYSFALANGIVLRYTAVNKGILALMDQIDTVDPGHRSVSVAVYSFDNALTTNSSLSTDTSSVRSNLPTAPATSSMTAGATHFDEIISQVVSKVGVSGDGSSPSNAIKLVIIATDGVEDPGRYWTSDVAARDLVAPFKMGFCDTLKSNGVNIGIIHTPYVAMTYDWGFNVTLGQPSKLGGLGTRFDDIPKGLQTCAGNRYILADNTAEITSAFTQIFRTLKAVRLSQ